MGDSTRSGRRQFLKHTAALAGVAVGAGAGAEWTARSQSGKPEEVVRRVAFRRRADHFAAAERSWRITAAYPQIASVPCG